MDFVPSERQWPQSQQVNCADCRVVLSVPFRPTTHVLCPPCNARLKLYPHPVVLPISETTRANHPHPVPTPAPPDDADARVSMRFGCATVLPKRVPRRAAERPCRPREPLDLLRASLLRETVQENNVKQEEDELEVDLVYPGDVPDATQDPSALSEQKTEESRHVQDEDVELELVYPEDTATATCPPPPKSPAKLTPPTTLCELFEDRLKNIPALQDPTALAEKTPPRYCQTPECNEVLLTQTCMQRCIKCSVSDWKRRKLAAMNAPDPSTTSLKTHTDVSMEEQEATTMRDKTSDIEDGNDLPPPSSSGSDSVTELGPKLVGPRTDATVRLLLLVHHLPSDGSPRKCGNERCNVVLPQDHPWNTCEQCWRSQRIRFESERKRMLESMDAHDRARHRWRSPSPGMPEPDVVLPPETSRPCAVKRCRIRIPLPEVYRWKTCIRCRARARRQARRKRDALLETQGAIRDVVPCFPAYQNRGALVSSFDAQLKEFVEGQIPYFRAKLSEDGGHGEYERTYDHAPMVFIFASEYSVVIGQRGDADVAASEPDAKAHGAMRQEVSRIVLDLERVLRVKFSAGEAYATDQGGMLMRFTCALELIASLRALAGGEDASCETVTLAPTPPTLTPAGPLVRTLKGELETVIVPDESHWLFHGRRTVVRYRMVG